MLGLVPSGRVWNFILLIRISYVARTFKVASPNTVFIFQISREEEALTNHQVTRQQSENNTNTQYLENREIRDFSLGFS
jgi:hypothetical protein